jgi:putative nucleotidyltransferase with HDIG domain
VGRLPPKVIAATTLVAVAPAGVVWGLRAAGIVGAFLPCAALGALLSLVTCSAAARLWERSDRAGDVLFGDLMIWGWIRRCHQERRLADAASLLGARRAPGATDPLSLSIERRTRLLEQLAADLEAGDPYTHGHSRRVARYATLIAKRMGVSGDELARIRLAAALHDVGKLETPTAVLHKPGRLTNSEFAIVREHPVTGAEMVSILEDPELSEIVLHHHERLDGTGYPDRLPGDQIPLGARIISVADTFDAITSARPYRAARPHRQALAILRSEAGTQLDGDAVTAFCSVYVGRRPLSAWVAVSDLGERLLTWLLPDALGSTARVAALAASAAAVGGGVAALPALGHSTTPATHTSTRVRASHTSDAARYTAARSPAVPAVDTGRGSGQTRARRSGSSSPGVANKPFGGHDRTKVGVHPLGGTPASSTHTTNGTQSAPSSGVSSASASDSSGSSDSSPASPVSVQTPTSTPSGVSTPSVGVTTSSGPGSGSVGVSASTGAGQTVGAGVTLGATGSAGVTVGTTGGLGVTATLPGVGQVKIGIGGGG